MFPLSLSASSPTAIWFSKEKIDTFMISLPINWPLLSCLLEFYLRIACLPANSPQCGLLNKRTRSNSEKFFRVICGVQENLLLHSKYLS